MPIPRSEQISRQVLSCAITSNSQHSISVDPDSPKVRTIGAGSSVGLQQNSRGQGEKAEFSVVDEFCDGLMTEREYCEYGVFLGGKWSKRQNSKVHRPRGYS